MRHLQSWASEHRIEVVNGGIQKTYQLEIIWWWEIIWLWNFVDSTDRLFGKRSTSSAAKSVDARKN